MKLAILIPTIEGREHFLEALVSNLQAQVSRLENPDDVLILINKDQGHAKGGKTIGEKRNILENHARILGATHRAFIDDDDTVTDDYLELNMPGVYGDYDCNSLVGVYSENGVVNPNKHIFIHSVKYDKWCEDDKFYYRNPNHLNVVKLALTENIKFQEKNFGEDGCWSEDIFKAGVLKNEYEITKPFYNYLFRTKVNGI